MTCEITIAETAALRKAKPLRLHIHRVAERMRTAPAVLSGDALVDLIISEAMAAATTVGGSELARVNMEFAKNKFADVESARDAEISEMRRTIEKRHGDAISEARDVLINATATYNEALIVESNAHPMVGQKVKMVSRRKKRGASSWSRDAYESVTIYGIVEVTTPETRFAGNMASYSIPKSGTIFVRLLKGDGTPGTKIELLGPAWEIA